MKRTIQLVSLSALIGLLACSVTVAQERKISRAALPAAVEATVARESQGATIKGFSTEVENGKRLYEVEMTVDGHGKDVSMDRNGTILEVEEEVRMDSLPAEVQEGLHKVAGAGMIGKIESLIKSGKLVAYEAHVTTGKRHSEIQVGPNGEKLAHPQ